jgi:hypothetical protein
LGAGGLRCSRRICCRCGRHCRWSDGCCWRRLRHRRRFAGGPRVSGRRRLRRTRWIASRYCSYERRHQEQRAHDCQQCFGSGHQLHPLRRCGPRPRLRVFVQRHLLIIRTIRASIGAFWAAA